MRRIFALLVFLTPSLAAAAGAPHAAGDPYTAGGPYTVTVPCYPESPLRLCAVPDAPVHAPGYLPRTVPTVVRLYPSSGRFVILVTPNVARYEYAVHDAARAAARHCGSEPSERVIARIDGIERHADEDVESWRFSGHCE